ncbi:MAG: hypothetical protein R3C05_29835, partial [Pirellulaceae bacterium]
DDDTLRVLVSGNPQPDQFQDLTVSAGIERMLVDNTDNPAAVDWIVSQGSLYFVDGTASITNIDLATETLTITPSGTLQTRPLANGDRVLIDSRIAGTTPAKVGRMPKYLSPTSLTNKELDAAQFYYVTQVSGNTVKLALTPTDAAQGIAIDMTQLTDDTLSLRRVEKLVSLEGAQHSEVLGGGDEVDTLSVVTPLNATVDVTGNELRIIEGALVLEHESNLSKASFPLGRIDGLQGVQSVVAMQTAPFVFAAGTGEDKLALFYRVADPNVLQGSTLKFAGVVDTNVPITPHTLKLSPDERFLYVLGESKISVFRIDNQSGQPRLYWLQDVSGGTVGEIQSVSRNATDPVQTDTTNLPKASSNLSLLFESPTDLETSRVIVLGEDIIDKGTRLYVTDSGSEDGIVVFQRDVSTGLLTQVVQKLRKTNSFGKAVDVGNDPVDQTYAGTLSEGNPIVLDEPFVQPINGNGTYKFYAWNQSQITPVLLAAGRRRSHRSEFAGCLGNRSDGNNKGYPRSGS